MASTLTHGLYRRSQRVFRSCAMVCAALLGMQCIWLLLPELVRPNIDQLPTNASAALKTAKHHDAAIWAASVGLIRGELWAESAFTRADLLWRNHEQAIESLSAALQGARTSLDHALSNAPHISGAWLMLAGLASHPNFSRGNAIEFLKLSYYTGPSEQELLLLRLEIAVRLESFDDLDMRPLITRDIRSLLAQEQGAAIAKIYDAASANAKTFLEQTIREVDPSAIDKIRTGGPKQLQLPQ